MKRFTGLDGLRGLAAIVVVLFHLSMVPPGLNEALQKSVVLSPLVAGESAVYLFFVLSGFVLYLAFTSVDASNAAPFIAKRIARIYPPVILVVVLSALGQVLVGSHPLPVVNEWLGRSWTAAPTVPAVVAQASLAARDFPLDIALWSLAVEVEASLLFPLIAGAVRRRPATALAASFVLSLGCRILAERNGVSWPASPLVAGRYLFLFVAGAVLARSTGVLSARVGKLSWPVHLPIAVVAVALITVSPRHFGAIPTSIGAIILVLLIGHNEDMARALSIAPLRALGAMSYSVYLVHLIVILTVVHAVGSAVPLYLLLIIAASASIAVAAVLASVVERPSIYLGRLAASLMRRRLPEARVQPS